MPVEDIEVHEKVRVGSDFKYGCNSDKERANGYWVQVRKYNKNGKYKIVDKLIEHEMTTKCRSFALWDTDSACRDCQREKDYQYEKKCLSLR